MHATRHIIKTLLTITALCHVTCPAPVVRAPWGSVQGVDIEGQGGRRFSGYLGIPFALPPTGPLRWHKPQPHPGPGDGQVFVADTLMPACPQELPGLGVYNGMSEDCLTLNVFVPQGADTSPSPLPVLIFIHGGGFTYGDAPPYRPTKLVSDGGVIVVTIQYRLGTLGFLTTGDDHVLGNFGLWDQTLAIRWVKDNIRAFGGDPEAITISGESAGGMSVGVLTVSPQSKGLFRRAVLQSGTPNFITDFIRDERGNFVKLSKALDCEAETTLKMLDCLKNKPADDIVNMTSVLGVESQEIVLFLPRVDGDFLPSRPLDLLKDEQYVKDVGVGDLDILVGFNNNEGSVVCFNAILMGESMESINDPAAFQMMLDFAVVMGNAGVLDGTVKKVVEFFYRGADAGTDAKIPLKTLTDMMGDAEFYAPSVNWIRTLAAQPHTGSRYMYHLDHHFSFNQEDLPGSHHGDDLLLQFEILQYENSAFVKLNKTGLAKEEEALSDHFVGLLTSFVKTGNPGDHLKDSLGGDWPQFTTQDEAYLALSLTPRVERDILKDRLALWLNLVPRIAESMQGAQREQTTDSTEKDEL